MLFLIMLFLINGCPIPHPTFGMQILHPYQVRMAILRSQEEEEGDNTLMVGREREEEEKLKPVAFQLKPVVCTCITSNWFDSVCTGLVSVVVQSLQRCFISSVCTYRP
jgi:hypothetical protein